MVILLLAVPLLSCGILLSNFFYQWVKQTPLRNIPGPPTASLWKGNLGQIFNQHGWKFHADLLEKYGRIIRLHGLFGDTQLYITDPRALRNIVRDQDTFEETSLFIERNRLVFGMGLLSTLGAHHRKQRRLLNPVFSDHHMRNMISIFYRISEKVIIYSSTSPGVRVIACRLMRRYNKCRESLIQKVVECPQEVDVLDWMRRIALELVGQGGLGYSFGSFDDGVENSYGAAVKNLMPTLFSLHMPLQLVPWTAKHVPLRIRAFLAKYVPWKSLRELYDIVTLMDETAKQIYNTKLEGLQEGDNQVLHQIEEERDVMSVLLKANVAAAKEDQLPDSELIGQMTTLVFAAMDTTSAALARTLHLLAEHQAIQDQLRLELRKAYADGDLDYDHLHGLPYLDSICRETLRLYPTIPFLSRTTRNDVVLPLVNPILGEDGTKISEVPIPNNTNVIISIIGVNRDPAIWGDDALEWKPQRWHSALPSSVMEANIPSVYSNTMTFLSGGRACIGFRFAQLELKVVLAKLIPIFHFSLSKKEVVWKMGGITAPAVKGSSQPSMPLILSLVKETP